MAENLSHLRADARDNRDRIIEAAREVFAEVGLEAPMREIARRAQVGPATLYRRFPTKDALVAEAFSDQMRACGRIVDDGLADPDPWHGFCSVVERVFDLHARDWGFSAAFMKTFPRAMNFAASRDDSLAKMARLVGRAKRSGGLRRDFVMEDLMIVIMANGGIRTESTSASVAASRRFAALALQAFAADPSRVKLPPAARVPLVIR
ncbi:TetR/AcrR family transcriptional regulator [Kineosporia babensis]|uniref:TetR/AcrR family transcriptional regulator n=1 Tax=Kineosporia babensis TaxID=499548 RepID=A0A9X1SSW2_9ACTN|nr:helix-turn-helix domain-containing protein [Kineosporia babensis]MCD5310989.1 TetR/AcrR family transcriptional regulator [Kineosporia babensis]